MVERQSKRLSSTFRHRVLLNAKQCLIPSRHFTRKDFYLLSQSTRERWTSCDIHTSKDIVWKEHETDTISAIENRLIAFPSEIIHQVQPYEGNRVSIGMIFWVDLPKIYPAANPNMNMYFDRVWEIEDAKQIAMYV